MPPALTDPAKTKRLALPVKLPVKPKQEKRDRKEMLETWSIATDIIERIKAAPLDKPFFVDIGLNEAMDLLTINLDHNRTLNEQLIKGYAAKMSAGRWPLTSQSTIGYNVEGRIDNCQHRLWAIVDSGATIPFVIIKGLPPESVANTDTGMNRTGKNIYEIMGFGDKSSAMANATKNIILYSKSSQIRANVSQRQVSNDEVYRFAQNEVRAKQMAKDLDYIRDLWMIRATDFFLDHQWLLIYYILKDLPRMEAEAKKFLDTFASGTNLGENNPIHVVRQYFINDFGHLTRGRDKKTIERNMLTYKVKHVFKAWELKLKNVRCTSFEVDKSLDIPKPYFPGA